VYFGLYALQHRGQESAGIAVFNEGKVRLHKDMGLVSQVFDQEVLERMPGGLAVGHNRYSTTGSSKVCNAQPVVLMTRLGPFALAHNGNLVNAAELRAQVDDGEVEFTSSDGFRVDRLRGSTGCGWGVGLDRGDQSGRGPMPGGFQFGDWNLRCPVRLA
jgi:glutamine phosphoribosylpyrophosphate amidotransferase